MNPSDRIAELTQALSKARQTIHNQRKQLRSLHALWAVVRWQQKAGPKLVAEAHRVIRVNIAEAGNLRRKIAEDQERIQRLEEERDQARAERDYLEELPVSLKETTETP